MTKSNPDHDPSILEVNGVCLNAETREAVCDGVPVNITPVEFEILQILMRSAGQIVTKAELARTLDAKGANPFKGSLDVQVNQLKSKLERGRRLIRIVESAGYVFAGGDEKRASNYQLT